MAGTSNAWQVTMTAAGDSSRRWDTDERHGGVADATVFAAAVDELAALIRRPGWVTGEPGIHLTPHLSGADVAGISVLDCRAGEDGVLDVDAEHRPADTPRVIRRQAWALIGTIAEQATCVRERRDGDRLVFEIVTGVPEGSSPFATHGHTVRLNIHPPPA
jgi:hypothetical protein